LLGVGSNNFSTVMEGYVTRELQRDFLYTVHNKYLLVWTEVGVGGLLAYLAFLFGVLRKGWACWKSNDPLLAPLALGLRPVALDIWSIRPWTSFTIERLHSYFGSLPACFSLSTIFCASGLPHSIRFRHYLEPLP